MKPCIYLMVFFAIRVVANLGAVEPLFDIDMSPDATSFDISNTPIISRDAMVEYGVENAKSSLSKDVEVAISSNDLPSLSRMLQSSNVIDQIHAAIALGNLTAHKSEAQELLAGFIAAKTGLMRTEFGVDSINRQIAVAVAEESLEAIGLPSESSSSPQEPQQPRTSSEPMPAPKAPAPIKSPQATQTPVEESPSSTRWPVVAVVIVAVLGLLWVWLKKRK